MLAPTMRALVVEDESKMAALLRRGLQEEGYAVDVASTGADGTWLGNENDYDVILLDAMLPDINGFEVCRRLRAAGRWSPVLMLTARTTTSRSPSRSTSSSRGSGRCCGEDRRSARRSSPPATWCWTRRGAA